VAYRLHGDGFVSGVSSLSATTITAGVLPLVLGLGLLLALGLRGLRTSPAFVRLWIVTAAFGAVGGGLFHAHYFIELVPPLSLAAAYAIERMRDQRRLVEPGIAAVLAAASAAVVIGALATPVGRQIRIFFPRDLHLAHDAAIARAAARTPSPILVVPPIASIVYLSNRTPAIPYLWARNVETIHAAAAAERNAILDERAGTLVVERSPGYLRAVGLSMADIRSHYRVVATTWGATVYRARG
jgi:hypothetical protein